MLSEEELLQVFQALSNPSRRQILVWLKDPMSFPGQEPEDVEIGVCVSDIQRRIGLSPSTTSQYLTLLRQAGLVTATRRGKWTYYRRDEDRIALLLRTLGEVF
ncbi:helix-turn-helix domain-containing protein [Nocardia asteroides]|uniref:ArsR/SmtB family transcription factor n=1 Tax=Nocardia TaxID=1817 RepID=UPI001358BFDA|nr:MULTISPECIES: metalloregulator ArsR/SmtB family transcription factor [Nocardia]MBF6208058.1 helix-turn-helix transcriptional regulator [Streptomyces gardneri]UAK34305.1 helix-turn-helix domain-containing protein [Nocardia asteroides]